MLNLILFFQWCSKDLDIPFQVKLRCYVAYGGRESIKGLKCPISGSRRNNVSEFRDILIG